jgi:hypothetical protein
MAACQILQRRQKFRKANASGHSNTLSLEAFAGDAIWFPRYFRRNPV